MRELGTDLIQITWLRRFVSLALPVVCVGGYFACAFAGYWWAAVLTVVTLSFVTYPSTSHDLVHRSLGLPNRANELLLCIYELLALRSGHAYRTGHLHHHARFPANDDLEGAAAMMSWARALLDGVTLQVRIWWWAVRRGSRDRAWMIGEALGCVALLAAAAILTVWTPVLLIYASLMVAGSWVIPLATSYIPHRSAGENELSQTRAYRGIVASVIGLGLLYHLEHHLYPAVPHQNWRKLASRLDPYMNDAGVRPVRLWF